MTRRDTVMELDPAQVEELEALDRALSGERVDPRHAAVEELVALVRADAQRMDVAFADRLDARVAERSRPPERRRGRLLAAGGGLATALAAGIAAVVLAGGTGGHRVATPISGPALALPGSVAAAPSSVGGSSPVPRSPTTPSAALATAAPSVSLPVPLPPLPTPGSPRQVQRAASLSLTVAAGQVQPATDRAVAVTERLGGIVRSSNVSTGSPGSGQASLDLQIPSAQLDPALAQLSALGHVSALTQNTQDVTDQIGAARRRLAEAEAERTSLLRQLGKATTPNEVASIHAQLGLVAGRISAAGQSLQQSLDQARYAHVQLTIADSGPAAGSGSGSGGWPLDAALRAAGRVVEAVLGGMLVALAVLVPPALAAWAAWAAVAALRRRRRERELHAQ